MPKKVLILTYYWPPSGGSGVQRWVYFSKHLLEYGFEPIVVTVSEKNAAYKNLDTSLVHHVEGIRVYRTKARDPLRAYSLLTTGSKHKGIPSGNVKTTKIGIIGKMAAFVRGNFFIPDARVGWNKFAYRQAEQLIQSENIDLIITTGPPHSTHLIGLKLKSTYPIKWIADFRDPWTDLYYNKVMRQMAFAKKKDAKLEQAVISGADKVLTVGYGLEKLLQKGSSASPEKFEHIYNGYDSDLTESIHADVHDAFEMTFIGILTKNQPYKEGIEAIKKATASHSEKKIRIVLAGNIQADIIDYFRSELGHLEIEMHGYVTHPEAVALMKRSQLLLNFLAISPHSDILISGKQMEYIATGNPILCLGSTTGELAKILESIPNGAIFEVNQTHEAAQFIDMLLDKWGNNIPFLNDTLSEAIRSKSRRATAQQLVTLINQL